MAVTKEKKAEQATDAKATILRFLTKGDNILSSGDETILGRWEYADLLMRGGTTHTETLVKAITKKFSVSRFTADLDILNAQEVFSKSRSVNRKYLGHLHLQRINQDIERYRARLFPAPARGKRTAPPPDPKDIQALAKLYESYTYQMNSLPDESPVGRPGKISLVFELPNSQQLPAPLPLADAIRMADELLEYEEVPINQNTHLNGNG